MSAAGAEESVQSAAVVQPAQMAVVEALLLQNITARLASMAGNLEMCACVHILGFQHAKVCFSICKGVFFKLKRCAFQYKKMCFQIEKGGFSN